MLAIRSQKNSLESFELEEEDVTRLKQSIMNLNGNFQKSRVPIYDYARTTFNIPLEFIESKIVKSL